MVVDQWLISLVTDEIIKLDCLEKLPFDGN